MDMAHSFTPNPDNTRLLRDAFGKFATGVTVVTSDSGMAITANSFSSVSLTPALVLWSPGRHSSRFEHFVKARHYAIHILAADQHDICWAVARDKGAISEIANGHNAQGVPVFDGCLARFDCELRAVHDAGDHAIVVGEVLQATMTDGEPLAFYQGKMSRIGQH